MRVTDKHNGKDTERLCRKTGKIVTRQKSRAERETEKCLSTRC